MCSYTKSTTRTSTSHTFSRDIKMLFGIGKCKTLCIAKGKLEMRKFTTEDDDTMEAMNEDDVGHIQA